MKNIFEISHVEVMRHAAKASRRGDFAELERLTRVADRLHRMMHRHPNIDREARQRQNEERRVRIDVRKKWGRF